MNEQEEVEDITVEEQEVPMHTYEANVLALDGGEEYWIHRVLVGWSVSKALVLVLTKNANETLVLMPKAWKTIEVKRNDYVPPTDISKQRRVDTSEGKSDYFDFIQIDNEVGLVQGLEGRPESPTRIVTYNPRYIEFLLITND